MDQITARLASQLTAQGLPAAQAFPQGAMPRLTVPRAAVMLESFRLVSGAFGDYLGMEEDPERGPVERYGRTARGQVQIRIYAADAGGTCAAATVAVAALEDGIPGIAVEEIRLAEPVFDPVSNCFYRALTVLFSARYLARRTEEDAGILRFILEGEVQ